MRYLEDVDPEAARIARERYGCLTPWEEDPATYGRAALSGEYRACEDEVVAMLQDLLEKRLAYAAQDGQRFFDAGQNACLVANAERYYRSIYYGYVSSWNLRDEHMFETLKSLLDFRGPDAKAVVWATTRTSGMPRPRRWACAASTTSVSSAASTSARRLISWASAPTAGRWLAASTWDGPMEVKEGRPSHERSYERLCP